MTSRSRALVGALVLCLVPAVVRAEGRTRIFVDGLFAPLRLDFAESRSITEFAEQGQYNLAYQNRSAPGLEVGLRQDLWPHVGLQVSVSSLNRSGSATYDASLPHPLYLNQPRKVSGSLTGLAYAEKSGRLGLVLSGSLGRLEVAIVAGAVLTSVEADVLDSIQYRQVYPYDTVTVTGTPTKAVKDTPLGFDVSARLDVRLGRHFAFGGHVRFSSAKASLAPSDTSRIEVDTGGLQLGLGLTLLP